MFAIGNESSCNAGDPGSIPGLGRSAGEGVGCLLHYSWASLEAQVVQNPPATRETWIRSLGWILVSPQMECNEQQGQPYILTSQMGILKLF